MSDGLLWHRIQFTFTVTYHYLFPQLTMGLPLPDRHFQDPRGCERAEERYNEVAWFWTRIFALNFAMGVVTGNLLEFQFGTELARFSRYAGEVVGRDPRHRGRVRLRPRVSRSSDCSSSARSDSARPSATSLVAVALCSWGRGSRATSSSPANAFMQQRSDTKCSPPTGLLHLGDLLCLLFCNPPWGVLGSICNNMAAVRGDGLLSSSRPSGAYWALTGRHAGHARICPRGGHRGAGLPAGLDHDADG